jgi:nitrite reductase (NO-forming)
VENQKGLPLRGFSVAYDATEVQPEVVVAQAAPPRRTSAPRQPSASTVHYGDHEFIEVIERDLALPIPPTSYVPQDATPDRSFTIELSEGRTYIGNDVVYDGFLTNGTIPGPTIVVDEGDIVEFTVVNKGTVPHGASIHAAYTQTSKYLGSISPGATKSLLFRATVPGVYLYHCAPGGHAIPMHVLFGQYGMMVVKPKQTKYRLEALLGHEPDVEIYLTQHEWYKSGADAIAGDPAYVTFNGKLFRYVEEPIRARPGDYVRIYFLNVGPNLLSTFHIVGIIWDFAYWQGHPEAVVPGGQTVTTGPSDSWVVEFRMPPDEGAFTMLSHAVGSTSRGAIGLLVGDREAETPVTILADGPSYSEVELESIVAGSRRTISPFKPGVNDLDPPVHFGEDVKEVTVRMIGNSFDPKVIVITPGTTVTFVNEDVFSYLAGEFSGIHNAAAVGGPERFVTPLLAHAESHSMVFTQEGENPYICTPHPYMEGSIIVRKVRTAGPGWTGSAAVALAAIACVLSIVAVSRRR